MPLQTRPRIPAVIRGAANRAWRRVNLRVYRLLLHHKTARRLPAILVRSGVWPAVCALRLPPMAQSACHSCSKRCMASSVCIKAATDGAIRRRCRQIGLSRQTYCQIPPILRASRRLANIVSPCCSSRTPNRSKSRANPHKAAIAGIRFAFPASSRLADFRPAMCHPYGGRNLPACLNAGGGGWPRWAGFTVLVCKASRRFGRKCG